MATTCVALACGVDFDVDAFLTSQPGLAVDARWRKGEAALVGRPPETSGFNSVVAEVETPALAIQKLMTVTHFDELLRAATAAGATNELDFSVELSPDWPMRSVTFSPDELSYCSARLLSITVSSYLCIDEEGDESS